MATERRLMPARVLVWPPTIGILYREAAFFQAGKDGARGGRISAPDRVHHRDRAAAHGGDVRQVHHHAAIAGELRIGGDEFGHEAFDGKQQKAIAIGDGGAIVSDLDRGIGTEIQGFQNRCDIALMGNAFGVL
jgi:hypothetical protein